MLFDIKEIATKPLEVKDGCLFAATTVEMALALVDDDGTIYQDRIPAIEAYLAMGREKLEHLIWERWAE